MTTSIYRSFLLFALLLLVLEACQRDRREVLAPEDTILRWDNPKHFPDPHFTFANFTPNEAMKSLGQRLFADPMLSKDGTISCASCHRPGASFADQGNARSRGVDGKEGVRNTPSLINLVWSPAFMWDGGVNHLELTPLGALTEEFEMHKDLGVLIEQLRKHPEYPDLYKEAFGDTLHYMQYTLRALTTFIAFQVEANTSFDKYLQGDESAFNSVQKEGWELFQEKCGSCHQGVLLSDFTYRNTGLQTTDDVGRMRITNDQADLNSFRVPMLRNVLKTGPYMHDGRFERLEDVMEHYRNGVEDQENLDPVLKNGQQIGIVMTDGEKEAILAFLRTL